MSDAHDGRSVQWTHVGISLLQGGKVAARVLFPVGHCGPADGGLTKEHTKWDNIADSWLKFGTIPLEAEVY